MDSKKVLEKLLRIAANQQKIIMKLAQAQGELPPDSLPNSQVSMTEGQGAPPAAAPLPQRLDPAKTMKTPAKALLEALAPAVRQTVVTIEAHGGDMLVKFQPGKATQPNYDAILKTLQDLTNKNVIQQKFNLKPV
jgi:hypothetical protein